MIRIALISKHYQQIEPLIQNILDQNNIEYRLSNYRHQSMQDIYFIEIERKEDLKMLDVIKKMDNTLIYIIGPRDFDLVRTCLELQTHLYLIKDELIEEFSKYEKRMEQHIQKNFQYYLYQKNGFISKIRLSQIYYVESLRHQVIIHSINGQMTERKSLGQLMKDLQSHDFIQIHKSYIVNKKMIKEIKGQEVILKDQTSLPIGRKYRETLLKAK